MSRNEAGSSTPRARTVARMPASSLVRYRVFRAATLSPSCAAANWATSHSGIVGSQTPSASPRRYPRAASPAASARLSDCSCR